MAVVLAAERPDAPAARALIDELEAHLASFYPRESRHGYSVDKLIARGVAFFVLRADDVPAACGGIELFGTQYGELKRMYVRPQFRGRGFAKQILDRLSGHARDHRVQLLRLETGIHQREAIGLYEKAGFRKTSPFGEYRPDPLSLFYEKRI
jgi:putative acetyltransferase